MIEINNHGKDKFPWKETSVAKDFPLHSGCQKFRVSRFIQVLHIYLEEMHIYGHFSSSFSFFIMCHRCYSQCAVIQKKTNLETRLSIIILVVPIKSKMTKMQLRWFEQAKRIPVDALAR